MPDVRQHLETKCEHFFCYKVDGSEWKTREVQILLSKDWQDPPLKNRDLIRSTRRRLIAAKRNWDKTSNKKEWEQNIKSSRKFGVTLVNQRVPSQTLFYPKPIQKGVEQFRLLLVIWRSSFFKNDKKIPKSFQSFQMQLWRVRQFSECSKNHIELLKKIRKVSLCVLEYIEKFNAGGFSVKLECSEGKVSLEQGYALKKIIPVLHAMWVNMCFTSCHPLIQRYTNTNVNIIQI